MQNVTKFIIPLITLALVCVGGYGIYYIMKSREVEQLTQENHDHHTLFEAAKALEEEWKSGDEQQLFPAGQLNCPDLIDNKTEVSKSYFRCNPLFLMCKYEVNPFKLRKGKTIIPIKLQFEKEGRRFYTTHNQMRGGDYPNNALWVRLSLEGRTSKSIEILLENTCSQVYLPNRLYAYGAYYRNSEDWRWDNFNQKIFVDKFLVTNKDIWEWKTQSSSSFAKNVPLNSKAENLPKPAGDLSEREREEYCAFRGGELLTAQVFDAMSFFPMELDNVRPQKNLRNPYYWTRKRKGTFPELFRGKEDFFLKESYCKKIFGKECLGRFNRKFYRDDEPSWMGAFNLMGGPMEVLRNPYDPKRNLNPSSEYFSLSSSWHELGKRAHWKGTGFFKEDINWGLRGDVPGGEDSGPYKIGFRCMRRVYE